MAEEESIELDVVDDVAEYCATQAREMETEIERMGIVLNIDWTDENQVRALAREALDHARQDAADYENHPDDYQLKAKVTLFALADMMMHLMARSADKGIHTHGGLAWKAFSRALMKERGIPIIAS